MAYNVACHAILHGIQLMPMDPNPSPLRKYRRATGLSMEALAGKVGVSPSQMSRIERKGTHSLPVAMKLADLTGLPVTSFAPVEGVA